MLLSVLSFLLCQLNQMPLSDLRHRELTVGIRSIPPLWWEILCGRLPLPVGILSIPLVAAADSPCGVAALFPLVW
jgi:hypothetical protein